MYMCVYDVPSVSFCIFILFLLGMGEHIKTCLPLRNTALD